MQGRFKRRCAVGLIGLMLALPQQAFACLAPSFEDYHLPSCTIPEPRNGEVVTVVAASGPLPSATVHVGAPTEATVFARIMVAPSEMRHVLVLESHRQIIWSINGDTDSVSRVIVLGATGLGPWAAGVIGLPSHKVIFTEPDLSALEAVTQTSCTRIFQACSAAQWFGDLPSDQVTFHPALTQGRLKADAIIGSMRSRPDGDAKTAWPVTLAPLDLLDEPVIVNPAEVVSPRPAQPYDQPTGQAGLDALRAAGVLLAPGDPGFDVTVSAWAEGFSARYRTRFAPDFLFVPQVDYVVTRPITLPTASPSSVYLLAAGVALPEMNGNQDDYRACFLELDTAGQPAERMRLDSPYCRDVILGVQEPDKEILYSALNADISEQGGDCRQMVVPYGAKIVVLNVIETGPQRYWDEPSREIAVEVAEAGPVVLYLHNTGGPARWVLSGTGVAQVFFLRSAEFQPPVSLDGGDVPQAKLGVDREGCPWFPPLHLNAPGYLHLDEMMKTLLGQPIDRVVEVTLDGAGPARVVVE